MSKIWLIMLISSVSTLLFVNPAGAVEAMLAGSNSALTLAMTLVATYGFWLGFFAVLEKTGIADLISRLLRPVIRFLFGGSSDEAQKYVAMNMSANLLGLGNAATPMGIKAVELLGNNEERANDNVKMLIIISSTSLQLLPSTVISMRIAHHSAFPTAFLLACTVATVCSTLIGVALCKIFAKLGAKNSTGYRKNLGACHKKANTYAQFIDASPTNSTKLKTSRAQKNE